VELFQEDTHFYIKRYPHANVEYEYACKTIETLTFTFNCLGHCRSSIYWNTSD